MSFFNLFNAIPSTYKVELRKEKLIKQHSFYKEFLASDKYSKFCQLKDFVTSEEFKIRKAEIENQKFSDTEEYGKLQRYNELKRDKAIRSYFSFKSSKSLSLIKNIEESGLAEKYNDLWKIVDSQEFIEASKQENFESTQKYKTFQEFNKIKSDPNFKNYLKLADSDEYSNYLEIKESDVLVEFLDLEQFIHSDGFVSFKSTLTSSKKRKFLKSEEFNLLQDFKKMLRDQDIISFNKLSRSADFSEIEKWEVTFEDNFKESTIDKEKWSDKFFWGEQIIKDGFSVDGDLHTYKTTNSTLANGVLKLSAKKEIAEGKIWNPKFGFIPRKFDYTAALINTGKSFRQQYGKFEAKIKISNPSKINQSFWMVAEKSAPHINILNAQKGNIEMGIINKNNDQIINDTYRTSAGKFDNKFFIFTFEWTPEKLTWFINDKVVKTVTTNIPKEPMMIAFSTGITGKANDSILPSVMEIDWVRGYSLKEMN